MKREFSHRVRPRHGGCRNGRPHTGIRAGTWLTVLTAAIVPPGHLQLHAAGPDPDGHFFGEAIRSKERAAELYVSALQLVAGEFLDLITGDVTGVKSSSNLTQDSRSKLTHLFPVETDPSSRAVAVPTFGRPAPGGEQTPQCKRLDDVFPCLDVLT